ncbi:MAG: RNA methyltransferase [Anaerolineaceae bacterium]|nr:RNA methyltransferase [Anaerolineaceae bacterium]
MKPTSHPIISSSHNPHLQRVRALLEKKKQRDEEQAFVVEGVRLVEEGLASRWQPELVLYTARLSERGREVVYGLEGAGAKALQVEPHLLESAAGTETPQGLLAIFKRPLVVLPEQLDFILIADALHDPGNLGTLLRTAAAAGAQAVLLSPGSTDAFSPKVLRAGMGAHFRLPILPLEWVKIQAICRGKHLQVFLAESAGGVSCWDVDLHRPLALLVGSEADGASAEGQSLAKQSIHIPMPGQSESLNAAVAASILMFEVVRQRRGNPASRQGDDNGS